MLIYFSLLIPIIATIVLLVKFSKNMTWWEYLLNFGVPASLIFIAKVISTTSQTDTTEIWNNYLTSATYYEEWNERIKKTCYKTCYDKCKNKDGKTYDCNPHDCKQYDCSYTDNHQASFEAITNQGKKINILLPQFSDMCLLWKNRTFVDMNRDYYTIDGNAYTTVADTSLDNVIPYTTEHTYENKVKCSRSVFNFEEVDTGDFKQFGLFNYPKFSTYNYNPILGWSNQSASRRLQQHNSRLGSLKQVHMLILVFVNQPVQAAILQQSYWKNGNKNEFILCIGISNQDVMKTHMIDWAHVISWTEEDKLRIDVAKNVSKMKFDLIEIIDYMAQEVKVSFVRKQFKDFSYITVEPTTFSVVITFILTLIVTIVISVFAINNKFMQEEN